jgi:hypothetical protein
MRQWEELAAKSCHAELRHWHLKGNKAQFVFRCADDR